MIQRSLYVMLLRADLEYFGAPEEETNKTSLSSHPTYLRPNITMWRSQSYNNWWYPYKLPNPISHAYELL